MLIVPMCSGEHPASCARIAATLLLQYRPWQENQSPPLLATVPRWQGESLPEATILVEEEEGYGDNIHFCRYLPLLARRCGKVLVRCRPALAPACPHKVHPANNAVDP